MAVFAPKEAASRQYVYNKDRILYPMKQVEKKERENLREFPGMKLFALYGTGLIKSGKSMVRSLWFFMRDIRSGFGLRC